MEIPSSAAGVVKELKVKLGDKVNIGDLIAVLEGAAARRGAAARCRTAPPPPRRAGATGSRAGSRAHAAHRRAAAARARRRPTGNAAARIAFGAQVRARTRRAARRGEGHRSQGPHHAGRRAGLHQGRDDGRGAAPRPRRPRRRPAAAAARRSGLLPWPKVDFAKFGPVERKDLSRIKKISGANLHRNWVMIPHVTNHDDADITELEAFRVQLNKENEKSGVKVTMLAFLIKACVAALKKFPEFNCSLDGEQLVLKQYFHIGFAADTPNGLVVPVHQGRRQEGRARRSARKWASWRRRRATASSARPTCRAACFTISSLGGIGGTLLHADHQRARSRDPRRVQEPDRSRCGTASSSQPRLMLPLSLSWDHRVIDGAAAARFNAYLGAILADFRRVLL